MIALSIVFVAAEIVHAAAGPSGPDRARAVDRRVHVRIAARVRFRRRARRSRLPQNAIPVALLFFNVGVEIGQLLFIGAVFALVAAARGSRLARACRCPIARLHVLRLVPPYAIGAIAMFWVIQRVAAF